MVAVCEPGEPIYPGLRETGRVERGGGSLGDPGGKPYHVVINAENYHALEALGFCYAGRVDCVYIDPPYNTGAKDWKYNNDYVGKTDAYRHSKWLAWMERRLKLAKKLLNPDNSVLVCTIDEKEYLRLGLLLEQTFPEAQMQMVSDVIHPEGVYRTRQFSRVDEYIYVLCFGDCVPADQEDNMLDPLQQDKKNRRVQWRSMLRGGSHSSRAERENLFYPIWIDETNKRIVGAGQAPGKGVDRQSVPAPDGVHALWPLHANGEEGRWQLGRETFLSRLEDGAARLGRKDKRTGQWSINYLNQGVFDEIANGSISVRGKDQDGFVFLERNKSKPVSARSVWNRKRHDANRYGTDTLARLLGSGKRFSYPKSLYAVEDALRFFIGDKPDALVLDFFAGSGTTAHAVMRLNHQDGGRRISISVTNNEVSAAEERELTAAGLRQGDAGWEKHGICRDVTIPRIRAAITGRTPQNQPIKGDYRFTDPFPMADGFKENAVFFDLIYQDPYQVELRRGFQAIAPLLWMRAGCRGPIIRKENDAYAIADTYAVLFHWSAVNAFIKRLEEQPEARTVYVVTDDPTQYTRLCGMLPDRDVIRLYRSYLESFKIASEGAVD